MKNKVKEKDKVYSKFKTYDPYTEKEYSGHLQIINGKLYGVSTSKPLIIEAIDE